MRSYILSVIVILAITSCCKKNEGPQYSGTITIDNVLYGSGPYYAYAFSVPTGRKISTLNSPLDAITVMADADIDYNLRSIFFATDNFKNSFDLYGKYSDGNLMPSVGNLDYEQAIRKVREVGYSSVFTIELEDRPNYIDVLKYIGKLKR